MVSIHKSLLQFVFSGSYMKRWNDKLRPVEFIELDKQAHKMIVAWLLCELNSEGMNSDDAVNLRRDVLERGMFDYFFRLVITDIKPPVYYKIKKKPEQYAQLAAWTLGELEKHLRPLGGEFWSKLEDYILNPNQWGLADRILDAAHNYASYWELRVIKDLNSFDDEMPEIEQSFKDNLARHYADSDLELIGVRELSEVKDSALNRFAGLCGQLRFQKRWSQTPRIPETSVMGHMFLVACYAYFFSLHQEACPARIVNNFFCGLFHDLPELLTRDIISPVKNSVEHLGDLIRECEQEELERKVIGPLNREGYKNITARLSYYLGLEVTSEFVETIRRDGKVCESNFAELHANYNTNVWDPKDGTMLKACDSLAAFMEAYVAVRNGIHSDQLQEGMWRIRNTYAKKSFGTLHMGALFADFD